MTIKSKKQKTESFRVSGEDLLKRVKALIHEGNIRNITIEDKNGKTILIFPLSIGVVGAVLVPPLAAIGVLAALLTECIIKVEREG